MKTKLTSIIILFTAIALNAGAVPNKAKNINPLQPGDNAPKVAFSSVDGNEVHLEKIIQGKKTALIFYRGGWCPYCVKQLSALLDVEEALEKEGIQLLAISPDKPEELKKAESEHGLGYTLLSDSSAEAAKAFGVAFKVNEVTIKLYKGYGIDLEEASGETHHILPVPAVFLIGSEGQIHYTYANPDYKVRLSGDDLLKAAESLK